MDDAGTSPGKTKGAEPWLPKQHRVVQHPTGIVKNVGRFNIHEPPAGVRIGRNPRAPGTPEQLFITKGKGLFSGYLS
jgi:hypothetical protein